MHLQSKPKTLDCMTKPLYNKICVDFRDPSAADHKNYCIIIINKCVNTHH